MSVRPPLVIGIIGLPCAGKSAVAAILRRAGAQALEADMIGHKVMQTPTVRQAIIRRFSKGVCRGNRIDRRALAAIVFSDAKQRKCLERIVHPPMIRLMLRRLRGCRRPTAIVAAILFRLGLHRLCDRIWLVSAPAAMRLARARRRGWSRQELAKRSRSVRDDIEAHRSLVDVVIANDGDLRRLRRSVRKIWKEEIYAATSRKKT